ncbi:hypothetical protein [Actinomadura sp. 6N118]|uniref:hypothetical protein n=1 Tax=Actinomadura sp. 6N118 TaxID=3375151 RepID=UPI00378D2BA5
MNLSSLTAASVIAFAAVAGCSDAKDPPPPAPTTTAQPTKPQPTKTTQPAQPKPTLKPKPKPKPTRQALPEECRSPAGGSVRQSCIKEFGPEGVGEVQPPKEEWPGQEKTRERNSRVEVPPKEEQIAQCIEQTGMPEECREKIDP